MDPIPFTRRLNSRGMLESGNRFIIPGMPGKSAVSPVSTADQLGGDTATPVATAYSDSMVPYDPQASPNSNDAPFSAFQSNPTSQFSAKAKMTAGNIGNKLSEMVPYVSNIVNSFRKAPMPARYKSMPFTTLSGINLDNERAAVRASTTSANRSAERNVSANTAELLKQYNRGKEFEFLSSIGERENNANSGIRNQQASLDAQVNAANTAMENQYRDSLVERQIANQRESSANISNAADKYVLAKNEKNKASLEIEKAKVLRSMYDKSGVLKRYAEKLKQSGVKDPFNENFKWAE